MNTKQNISFPIGITLGICGGFVFFFGGYFYAEKDYDRHLAERIGLLIDAYQAIHPEAGKVKNVEIAKERIAKYLGVLVTDYREAQRSAVRRNLIDSDSYAQRTLETRWDSIIEVATPYSKNDSSSLPK